MGRNFDWKCSQTHLKILWKSSVTSEKELCRNKRIGWSWEGQDGPWKLALQENNIEVMQLLSMHTVRERRVQKQGIDPLGCVFCRWWCYAFQMQYGQIYTIYITIKCMYMWDAM
jgi:hypothetical protein